MCEVVVAAFNQTFFSNDYKATHIGKYLQEILKYILSTYTMIAGPSGISEEEMSANFMLTKLHKVVKL
jgi:hypothetical protein